MVKPKIGLLPLYIELYDRVAPEARPRMEAFLQTIASQLQARGLDVVASQICRVEAEFDSAIKAFETAQVDSIVTLHMAYSPSLESLKSLSSTELPIVVLDTTPTYSYAPDQDPAELMYNHGIHGVQDMCNVLLRSGKRFEIEAGHWEKSDVLDRVAAWARAAALGSQMRNARIGRIGLPFKGMGDFAVETYVLMDTIGVQTVVADFQTLSAMVPQPDELEVAAEMAEDLRMFSVDDLDPECHRNTARTDLAVRRWMEKERLTGFTFNFASIDSSSGLPTVPFLEASKSLARGKGYAGEGDVLTAALVGALVSLYPDTTFTEMFCPDWEHDTIFLSHMGEVNPNLLDGKAVLMRKSLPFLDTADPVMALGRLRAGDAVLVNLAPGREETYSLIVSPVVMQQPEVEDRMGDTVRGWFRPSMPIDDFLAHYSCLGGTHHSALVYGDVADDIARFGRIMGWEVYIL